MNPARRRFALALLVLAAVPACGSRRGSAVPADASTTVLSLKKLRCEACGAEATEALRGEPGVYAVEFDKQRAEATVKHEPAIAPARLIAVVQAAGFDAKEGAGAGEYIGRVTFPAGLDVAAIGQEGEAVALERHLVAGKVTVFDFFAVWCGPCKQVDRHLVKVLQARPDVAVRKIDVVDWDSPVAARYLGDVPNLPYLVVYGVDGTKVAAISGLHLDELDAAIAKGGAR